jgi:hypothetical protein
VSADERKYIEERARSLGVAHHVTADGADHVWQHIVVPLVWGGALYQECYPLLVSDRYVIVEKSLAECDKQGTKLFAHGCTGMGNDQVRFDLTIKALGDYMIVAPIREIQKEHTQTRAYEQVYLEERGFGVRAKQKSYTINENLLGVTMSGGEIDRWESPGEDARGWCASRADWPATPLRVTLTLTGPRPEPASLTSHVNAWSWPSFSLPCDPPRVITGGVVSSSLTTTPKISPAPTATGAGAASRGGDTAPCMICCWPYVTLAAVMSTAASTKVRNFMRRLQTRSD